MPIPSPAGVNPPPTASHQVPWSLVGLGVPELKADEVETRWKERVQPRVTGMLMHILDASDTKVAIMERVPSRSKERALEDGDEDSPVFQIYKFSPTFEGQACSSVDKEDGRLLYPYACVENLGDTFQEIISILLYFLSMSRSY